MGRVARTAFIAMASGSRALVAFDNSNEGQQLPLATFGPLGTGRQVVSHTTYGPGRLLNQAYISIGQSIEKQANRLAHNMGLGPIAVTELIEKAFEIAPEERQDKLDDLYDRLGSTDDHDIGELQKHCMRLMKYALP